MKFSNVLLTVTLMIFNCIYYRTGKTDCLYVSDMAKNPDSFIETTFSYGEIDTNSNNNDTRTIKILIDHDNWGEKYFARQQVPDEVFRMRYKDRAEYYKKYNMYSLGKTSDSTDSMLTSLFGDSKPYKEFFFKMKTAFQNRDSSQIADCIIFPLSILSEKSGKNCKVLNKNDFLKEYSKIITLNVIESVINQNYDSLFCRDQGCMTVSGHVWFTGMCLDNECSNVNIGIIAINQ